ncbi:MAG: hypothetical protein EBW83_08730 [Rhodobacterales bacterium]|nr:hypothetical protein [Rhodobacterales bacterium]NCX54802.1 hypothetical protein [Rhodobacterales bacterium]
MHPPLTALEAIKIGVAAGKQLHNLSKEIAEAKLCEFIVSSFNRPRQNGQNKCRTDDDVRVTIGTGWCLLWPFWRGY